MIYFETIETIKKPLSRRHKKAFAKLEVKDDKVSTQYFYPGEEEKLLLTIEEALKSESLSEMIYSISEESQYDAIYYEMQRLYKEELERKFCLLRNTLEIEENKFREYRKTQEEDRVVPWLLDCLDREFQRRREVEGRRTSLLLQVEDLKCRIELARGDIVLQNKRERLYHEGVLRFSQNQINSISDHIEYERFKLKGYKTAQEEQRLTTWILDCLDQKTDKTDKMLMENKTLCSQIEELRYQYVQMNKWLM